MHGTDIDTADSGYSRDKVKNELPIQPIPFIWDEMRSFTLHNFLYNIIIGIILNRVTLNS